MKIAVCPSDHNGYFDAILEKCYSEQPGPVIHIPKDLVTETIQMGLFTGLAGSN